MAFPSSDPEDIRRCRQEHRDQLDRQQVRNPALFVPMDLPLQCLSKAQQNQAEKEIRDFVAENLEEPRFAAIRGEIDLPQQVSRGISLQENVGSLAEQFGFEFAGAGLRSAEVEEVDRVERERATQELLDICDALDAAGLDGAFVLERLFEGDDEQVRRLLEGTEIAGGLGEIEATLEGVEEAFGGTFVTGAIAACRDRLAGPADGEVTPTQELLEELRERFDIVAADPDQAFTELQDRLRGAEERGIEAAVNRLSRGFGVRFDDIEDAIDSLRERIAQARGERLLIGDIQVRRIGDEVRVRIDADVPAEQQRLFDRWQDNVERRVRRELDLAQLPSPSPWVTVGEVLVRGEDLDKIDLTEGRERLGEVEEPRPIEAEGVEPEQVELPTAETDADELARRVIEVIRR